MAHKNNYYTIHACIIYKVHAYSPFYKCWWAFGSNHQKSKHFQMPRCVLTYSPNIWVVDWEMWFSAERWVPGAHSLCVSHLFQEGVCDSSVWYSWPSFKSPACRACEFTYPPIPKCLALRRNTINIEWTSMFVSRQIQISCVALHSFLFKCLKAWEIIFTLLPQPQGENR